MDQEMALLEVVLHLGPECSRRPREVKALAARMGPHPVLRLDQGCSRRRIVGQEASQGQLQGSQLFGLSCLCYFRVGEASSAAGHSGCGLELDSVALLLLLCQSQGWWLCIWPRPVAENKPRARREADWG